MLCMIFNTGVTEIEICYAIGMPVGIIIFYNHIGKKKITQDPTPIEVEMRKYGMRQRAAFMPRWHIRA